MRYKDQTKGLPPSVAARQHSLSQMERESGIDSLTAAERRELLDYIKKNVGAGCQHLMDIHKQVPHPKYGDRVPHFETQQVPDPLRCPCEEAQRFRAALR